MHPELSATYYLANFQTVLAFVAARYSDILSADEQAFIRQFHALTADARALLVRLIMRTRNLFAADALRYDEIADLSAAIADLHTVGFVEQDATLTLDELLLICSKSDLLAAPASAGLSPRLSKAGIKDAWEHLRDAPRTLADWLGDDHRQAVRLCVRPMADTCRLLFFGNLYQDWSEFVITDLGHLRYESVAIADSARGFAHRADLDTCLQLHQVRTRLDAGEAVAELYQGLPVVSDQHSATVASRLEKLRFQLGQAAERSKDWPLAQSIYVSCGYKGARHRLLRVHEQLGDWPAAYALAMAIVDDPASEEELHATSRALPRLARKLRQPVPELPARRSAPVAALHLAETPEICVEVSVAQALTDSQQQAHYVENTLFSSLFGLVFWEAIFAPVPGAFFNPFQAGPVDLFHPEFASRRGAGFAAGFATLASDDLADQLVARWRAKFGLQNHFVFWGSVDEALIRNAIRFIPRQSLDVIFTRMLADLKNHRSGFPDLIVFDAAAQHYELIEVKAPNDRVQDNQARWMDYFLRHDIPCRVVHVSWPTP